MNEFWFEFDPPRPARGALLLDASRGAAPFAPVLLSLLEGLRDEVPAAAWPEVGFLGGAKLWPLGEFLARADELLAANAGRGRFLTPTLLALPRLDRPVAVYAFGPLPDLEDWRGTPEFARAALAKLSPDIPLSDGRMDEAVAASVGELAALVCRPPSGARVRTGHGVPAEWDNDSYVPEPGGLATRDAARSRLRLCLLARQTPEPAGRLLSPDGDGTSVPLTPVDAPPPPAFRPLEPAEFTVLDQWRRQGRYDCACGAAHPAGRWVCDGGSAPVPLIPAFRELCEGAFVTVRLKTFAGQILPVARRALALPDGSVAVSGDEGPRRLMWDDEAEAWADAGAFAQAFVKLSGELYAVRL